MDNGSSPVGGAKLRDQRHDILFEPVRIGPVTAIAWATYAGHRYAEELEAAPIGDALPFRREVARLKD